VGFVEAFGIAAGDTPKLKAYRRLKKPNLVGQAGQRIHSDASESAGRAITGKGQRHPQVTTTFGLMQHANRLDGGDIQRKAWPRRI